MNSFLDALENKTNAYIAASLKKMEDFLIQKGAALSASDLKKLPRIQIKGTDKKNGKERRLSVELMEYYSKEHVSNSKGFNTISPLFDEGILMFGTETSGTYYTHFKILSEDEDFFEMMINEYVLYSGVTYLKNIVHIKEISKKSPAYVGEISYETINDFFLKRYTKEELKEFSDTDFEAIRVAIHDDERTIHDVDAIVNYTVMTFKSVNYIMEFYGNKSNTNSSDEFYDNSYFKIKNFPFEKIKIKQEYNNTDLENYLNAILEETNCNRIIKNNTIDKIINKIFEKEKIEQFYIAVGFAYSSGLKIIDLPIKKAKKCELIVGALQNYNNQNAKNRMDKATAKYINTLLNNASIELYTHKQSFYHGKFYYMCSDKKVFIIVGSSNITNRAFNSNFELDILYITSKNSPDDLMFINWYKALTKECQQITALDEECFEDLNLDSEFDFFHSLKEKLVSKKEVREKIKDLTDEDKKFRLDTWLELNPTEIYEDVEIDALKDYFMMVYSDSKRVVFESFHINNACYIFRIKSDIVELLKNIKMMTKTQMTLSEVYIGKGYHTQSKERFKDMIRKNFFDDK